MNKREIILILIQTLTEEQIAILYQFIIHMI